MNNFLQAVQDGNLLAAKAAFDEEMKMRTAIAIDAVRTEIGRNIGLEEDDE